MINILKKFPWWFWIVVMVGILILWQSLSGWAQSRKLYDMMLDQFREDQSRVIKDKEEWIADCEKEISELNSELQGVRKDKETQRAENGRLMEVIRGIQAQRENIVVPDDPDGIVRKFHELGFKSIHRRKQ
jgi:hypothetical protein